MVNLDDWDKISYSEIKEGEDILMVQQDKHRTFYFEGKAQKWDSLCQWWEMTGNWYANERHAGGLEVTFYKKKFIMPTTPLTIIEGENRWFTGSRSRFILTENGVWVSAKDGGTAIKTALLANFRDWKIIFEGTTDGDA